MEFYKWSSLESLQYGVLWCHLGVKLHYLFPEPTHVTQEGPLNICIAHYSWLNAQTPRLHPNQSINQPRQGLQKAISQCFNGQSAPRIGMHTRSHRRPFALAEPPASVSRAAFSASSRSLISIICLCCSSGRESKKATFASQSLTHSTSQLHFSTSA